MKLNEIRNAVVHYRWSANGTLTEVERVPTGGSGSGVFKPSGQDSAPNAFEGAGSVILTLDRRFLFATNGGDNSVSSFGVAQDGRLTLLDTKPTGNAVKGRSGTAKSLARLSPALLSPRPRATPPRCRGAKPRGTPSSAPGGTLGLSSAPRPPARLPSPCSAHRND